MPDRSAEPEALEETLDLLGDPEALESLRLAADEIERGEMEYLSLEEARAHWGRG